MGILGRSILFGTAFVLALVAVAFGLRKLRAAPEPTGRGPWVAVQRAFWSAYLLCRWPTWLPERKLCRS